MNVLFDLTFIEPEKTTGVSNFVTRLLQGLSKIENLSLFAICRENVDIPLNENFISTIHINYSKKISNIKSKKCYNEIIFKNSIDIFVTPYFHLWSVVGLNCLQLIVIHDLQAIRLQHNIVKKLLYKFIFNNKISKIDSIISISKFTKKEILKEFRKINSENIFVIYNSLSFPKSPSYVTGVDKYMPYILYTNTIEKYKNVLTLIKAFNLIRNDIPHFLIIKGHVSKYWQEQVYPLILDLGLKDRVIFISANLSDSEMSYLYSNASLFVNPSLMEGFGFTPIEAAIMKTPVISTKEGALYETTKQMLNYYNNPTDEKELSLAMLKILKKNVDKEKLEKISQFYMEYYSIKKQSERFYKLFNMLLENESSN